MSGVLAVSFWAMAGFIVAVTVLSRTTGGDVGTGYLAFTALICASAGVCFARLWFEEN